MQRRLLLAVVFVLAPCLRADVALNCGPIGGGNVHTVGGPAINTYCVSDWGSSDTWYPGFTPPFYDVLYDAFSGDDAVNLRYVIGGVLKSGSGWLPPILDAGYREPTYATGSAWAVTTGLFASGGGTQTSTITNPSGNLDITITTGTIGLTTIYQDYTITNGGASLVTGMRFADYFDYHPNGTSNGGYLDATVRFGGVAGMIVTGHPAAGDYISPGQMCFAAVGDTGCSIIPSAWNIGDVQPTAPPSGVRLGSPIKNAEADIYNGVFLAGEGDYAGTLAYDLPDLAPGQSTSIRVLKGSVLPLEPVPESGSAPEPGTLVLCGGALIVAGSLRRRGGRAA
jgi:hypothetical protein